jgi:hypothetical protein
VIKGFREKWTYSRITQERPLERRDSDPPVLLDARIHPVVRVGDRRADPVQKHSTQKSRVHAPLVMANHRRHKRLSVPHPQVTKVKGRIADLGVGPIDYARDPPTVA